MKEYICKEDIDLKRNCENVECWDCALGNKRVLDNIPTVTKADICKEIAEELCEQWNIDSLCSINNTEQMRIWIKSKLLNIAEKEQ